MEFALCGLLTIFGISIRSFCLILSIFGAQQHKILLKQRKHKTFNYKPRFSKESQADSSLDKNSNTKDFVSKWQQSKGTKVKTRGAMSMKVLILVLVLLLICMYVLEKKYM